MEPEDHGGKILSDLGVMYLQLQDLSSGNEKGKWRETGFIMLSGVNVTPKDEPNCT